MKRTLARARLEAEHALRRPRLWAYRALGRAERSRLRDIGRFLLMLASCVAVLVIVPILLGVAVDLMHTLGRQDVDPAPEVRDWLSLRNVVLLFALLVLGRWIIHARKRVVVEGFVDYTQGEAKAVSGLSTLLVTELGRLRELYHQTTELSVPTAVGVERQGGFGRGKEAAAFLTVSADDVTDVLEGAVASDAKIEVGPARIPVGPILAFMNRMTRGPRVVGTVHLTEAGGGPTLTAQLVGREASATWRVDHTEEPASDAQRKAFLDTMVRQLACRMYTQLTLAGSVRWQAVEAFNDYLRLYGDSSRTPRDRARFLKQAQGRLLYAVAEDERFDLAYYNLGVIYTQLAQAELSSERQSQDASSRADFDRDALIRARQEAARVAFVRATERNPSRWEAYYALAVTRFSLCEPAVKIDEVLDDGDPRRGQLREVVSLCDQALRVASHQRATTAAVHDLRGMALMRLGEDCTAAMASHRKAVRCAWREYCRAERAVRAQPARAFEKSERARANATASLNNLAFTYERRALVLDRGSRVSEPSRTGRHWLAASARVFGWALELGGRGSDLAAACQFERGGVFERLARWEEAAGEYEQANQIRPDHCEYLARRSRALACWSVTRGGDAGAALAASAVADAERALDRLARPFSVAVAPYAAPAVTARVNSTLEALEEMWTKLGEAEGLARILGVRTLLDQLQCFSAAELRDLRTRYAGEAWEREQVELTLARVHARDRRWDDAEEVLRSLVGHLETDLPGRLASFGVYAYHARALRETAKTADDHVVALRTAAECVRRDPLNVDGRHEAGRAHYALGQYADALASWEHALWLSPSDPYLHYEVAMCHRQMAGRRDDPEFERQMTLAAKHFEHAQELFDGEDLDGEAWSRLWLGRVAAERGDARAAITYLEAAEHGTATTAATLLLGEAHLAMEERVAAEDAFERCRKALRRPGQTARLTGRTTIDSGWGDELPRRAVLARIERGLAEATCIVAGESQNQALLDVALTRLGTARRHAAPLKRTSGQLAAYHVVERLCLETELAVRRGRGERVDAVRTALRRLSYDGSPDLEKTARELATAAKLQPGRNSFR